jgi:hypothetical protein
MRISHATSLRRAAATGSAAERRCPDRQATDRPGLADRTVALRLAATARPAALRRRQLTVRRQRHRPASNGLACVRVGSYPLRPPAHTGHRGRHSPRRAGPTDESTRAPHRGIGGGLQHGVNRHREARDGILKDQDTPPRQAAAEEARRGAPVAGAAAGVVAEAAAAETPARALASHSDGNRTLSRPGRPRSRRSRRRPRRSGYAHRSAAMRALEDDLASFRASCASRRQSVAWYRCSGRPAVP